MGKKFSSKTLSLFTVYSAALSSISISCHIQNFKSKCTMHGQDKMLVLVILNHETGYIG